MFDVEKVSEFLDERSGNIFVDIRYRASDDLIILYVQQEKIAERVRDGYTSLRQLEHIKYVINKKFDKGVEVIVIQSEDYFALESGIHQMLNRKFDDRILSLYFSFVGRDKTNAWIEVNELDETCRGTIEEHLRKLLNEANIDLASISWASTGAELPTMASLLRSLKINQPINVPGLLVLMRSDYPSIPDKWLRSKLDQLRKKGLIRRNPNGFYNLTSLAITVVPSGARSTSSDIERALALGRRKW